MLNHHHRIGRALVLVGFAKLPAFERALPRSEQVGPKVARGHLVDERGRHVGNGAVVVLVAAMCGVGTACPMSGSEEMLGRLKGLDGRARRGRKTRVWLSPPCQTTGRMLVGESCPCGCVCVCMCKCCEGAPRTSECDGGAASSSPTNCLLSSSDFYDPIPPSTLDHSTPHTHKIRLDGQGRLT